MTNPITRGALRRWWRDGRLRWGLGFLIVLGVAASVTNWLEIRGASNAARESNQQARELWLDQEAKNPHSAAHYGVHVFREPGAGALLDPGVLAYTGTTVFIEAHYKNDAADQPIMARSSLARFGTLNPAFFLALIVPLFLILCHFDVVAGERKSGRLPALAVTGISPRSWLFGTWMAAWLTPLVCVAVVMIMALILAGGNLDILGSWVVMAVGYLLYLGCILNLTFLVSAKTNHPASALLVMLALWILICLAAPRSAATLAEVQHPTPLKRALEQTVGDQKKEQLPDQLAKREGEEIARYGVASKEELPINLNALSMQTDEEVMDVLNDQHYAELYQSQRGQLGTYRYFSILSPMIPARFMSMGLAGTDMLAHHHFNEQTELYRRGFVKFLNDDMMVNSRTGDWGYQASKETWAQIPDFTYQPRSQNTLLKEVTPDLSILAVWFLLSGVLLYVSTGSLFRSVS